jgi:hypothetical protein
VGVVWPTGDQLRVWLTQQGVSAAVDGALVDDVVATATAKLVDLCDANGKPLDLDGPCPTTVSMAIVLEAARLLYRRQSPHGAAAFGEVAIRLRTIDVDVEALLGDRARLDPMP